MKNLYRSNTYGNQTIVIDGMWRTGKSLLGPIIGSFENVQKPKLDYNFEWMCVLNSIGSVSLNNSICMLQMYADLCTHNNFLSREINLRPYDDTGFLKNPKPLKSIMNLFKSDKDAIQNKILELKPSLLIYTHSVLQVGTPMAEAFGKRLKMLVVDRNPVYFLSQWAEYLEMIGTDPRELEITKVMEQFPGLFEEYEGSI